MTSLFINFNDQPWKNNISPVYNFKIKKTECTVLLT